LVVGRLAELALAASVRLRFGASARRPRSFRFEFVARACRAEARAAGGRPSSLQSVFAFASLKLRRTPRFVLQAPRGCATRSPKGEAWWARQDSNLQPDRYERSGSAERPCFLGVFYFDNLRSSAFVHVHAGPKRDPERGRRTKENGRFRHIRSPCLCVAANAPETTSVFGAIADMPGLAIAATRSRMTRN
jgi:hypothetical protein